MVVMAVLVDDAYLSVVFCFLLLTLVLGVSAKRMRLQGGGGGVLAF